MILVDTSVWIAVFRARAPLDLERHVSLDEVATCLLVVQEVLQGFRDEAAFRRARTGMLALPMIESPLTQSVFTEAVDLYRMARRVGLTIRSSADCLIAVCAMRHGLEILHRDRDFAALSRISPLRSRQV